MFSVGPSYNKLKTNLRLAVNRLKLLEKKKTELAQKARKEIADYISGQKEDRARIRVEHIIREDYLVEAYELLEMYCDLLLARFGLIQQMKELDEGIEEAINSILWAAPRLVTDVQELKVIADQLTAKYGKPFAEACRSNQFNKVNPKLIHKLSVHAPQKILVEKYMMEIAKSHGVAFTPDINVMRDDEVTMAEAMLIDFQNRGQQGYGFQFPSHPGVYPMVPPPSAPPPAYPPPSGPPPPGPMSKAFDYPTAQDPKQQFQAPASGPSAPFPDLPEPPHDIGGSSDEKDDAPRPGGDDVDFDDLSRRFQELKKKR